MIDVAFDVRETSHMSVGMCQYVRELAARLPRVAPDLSLATFGRGDNFDVAEQIGMPLELWRKRPRLAHFTSPFAPLVVPVPYVVTIHDLIDLHFPQWAKPKARWYYRVAVRRIARHARCVITDDVATAEDLERFYALAPNRIAVVPLGVDLPPVAPLRRDVPYVIYAGNHRPHKDLGTIVAAWSRVDPSLQLDLVLTGDEDAGLRRMTRARGRLLFVGDLPHGEVLRWMAGAAALVHAALREGFGLPLLEAVRLGTPVIAAAPAVPEPLRDRVATFPAGDADALARAIESAVRGEAKTRVEEARMATAELTWDRCAERTADVYRRLL